MCSNAILEQPITFSAEEYYGDFGRAATLGEMKSDSEEILYWPHNISEGFFYAAKLRPGLFFTLTDHHSDVPVNVDFSDHDATFGFVFMLAGSSGLVMSDFTQIKYDISYAQSEAHIVFFPDFSGISSMPAPFYRAVSIGVEPWLLKQFLPENTFFASLVTRALQEQIESLPSFFEQIPFTPLMNLRLHEMLACPFGGLRRYRFLESKVLELILLTTEGLAGVRSQPPCFPFLPQNYSFVEDVRNILLGSINSQPSLDELARRAGVSKTKLNQYFREAYGVPAFEYLRICRLERARSLLRTQGKSVTEVAFDVGYSEQTAFSKQFKKYFGFTPRECIR